MASFMYEYAPKDHDWSDVKLVPQYDGPDPVVAIMYTEEFTELMGLFRALAYKKEYSLRGLDLSEALLEINPASYTVWQYRRECLRTLREKLVEELDYMDQFAQDNPKNYQIWHHRRAVVTELRNQRIKLDEELGEREMIFTEAVFEEDAKNYHSWAHRQWAIKEFNLWDSELEFVENCIGEDIRNNSAWNQRWFIVHTRPNAAVTDDILQRELDFTFTKIEKVKKNESAWNYLRGMVNKYPSIKEVVLNKCSQLIEGDDYHNNYLAVGLVADLRYFSNSADNVQQSVKLFRKLIDIDSIRAKSWIRRVYEAEKKLADMA